MKMRPLRDRILVERIEEAEQRVGGIIIPDTAKEKPQSGRVIAVGKGRINDKGQVFPLDVKEGETVLFGKYAGSENISFFAKTTCSACWKASLSASWPWSDDRGNPTSQIPGPKSQGLRNK
jgi:chaperonin GroES